MLGDIAFFHALATIGPRLSSVVFACWPGMMVAIEAACGRSPTWLSLLVIALVLTLSGLSRVP